MHPLAGIRAKLDRGDKYVKALNSDERRVMGRKKPPKIRTLQEFDPKKSAWVVSVAGVDELPIRLGLIVSDAVHNFRSALDQLIFELAFMDTNGKEIESTQFPGSWHIDNWRTAKVQNEFLRGLTQSHKTMLKRFQPYRRWDGLNDPHPGRLLLDLSNDDKHRLTQPVLMCPNQVRFTVEHESFRDLYLPSGGWMYMHNILARPLELKTPICEFQVVATGPNRQMKVKGESDVFIGFRDGSPAVTYLHEIGRYARAVVEFFAPEFERPKSLRQRSLPRLGRLRPSEERPEMEFQSEFVFPSGEVFAGGQPIPGEPPIHGWPSPSKG